MTTFAPAELGRQRVIGLISALAVPQRAPDGVAPGERLVWRSGCLTVWARRRAPRNTLWRNATND